MEKGLKGVKGRSGGGIERSEGKGRSEGRIEE